MSSEILEYSQWESGTNQNSIPANDNNLRNRLINGLIISASTDAQPGSPNNGDAYIMTSGRSGAQWSTFDHNDLAIFMDGTWYAYAPSVGIVVNVAGSLQRWNGTAFVAAGAGAVDSVNGQTGAVVLDLNNLDDVDPSSPSDGDVLTWVAANNAWEPAAGGGGGGMANPMTTAGDIIVGGSSGTPTRLAAGTDGHVLTLASGTPTWAAVGGGGLTNWTDALNSSAPNATRTVASLTATGSATNIDAALAPKGNGAVSAHVADNAATGGNKRGTNAVDWQTTRSAAAQVASGNNSVVVGGTNNTASAVNSVVVGGTGNTASAASAFVGGGTSNSAQVGNACIVGGQSNTASATNAFIGGGGNNTTNGDYSWIPGGERATTRQLIGFGAYAAGRFAADGDAQVMRGVLRRATTNATTTELSANASGSSVNNQLVLPNGSCYAVKALVVVRENATGDSGAWEVTAVVKRGANAASTALVGTPTVTSIGADAGAATWTVAAVADTTYGALRFDVTGEASHNLRWVADIYACAQVAG